jgi:hypothetical protein
MEKNKGKSQTEKTQEKRLLKWQKRKKNYLKKKCFCFCETRREGAGADKRHRNIDDHLFVRIPPAFAPEAVGVDLDGKGAAHFKHIHELFIPKKKILEKFSTLDVMSALPFILS